MDLLSRRLDLLSPAIDENGVVYIGDNNGMFHAVNSDGTLKWKYSTNGIAESIKSSAAVGSDGTIYVGSDIDIFYAFNPDGTVKWSYTNAAGEDFGGSPVIAEDGTIYIGNDDDSMYAFNSDGTVKWTYATGSNIVRAAAIGADGSIYFGSEDDYFYALASDGSLKWRYHSLHPDEFRSTNIASNGVIYAGDGRGYLYAFNPESDGPMESVWPMFQVNQYNTGNIKAWPLDPDTSQAAGVTVAVTNVVATERSAASLKATYPGLAGFMPVKNTYDFNATVAPAGSNATFYFTSNQLNGTVAELWLYKLKPEGSVPFYRYYNGTGNHSEGFWWITDKTGTDAMNMSTVLSLGTEYRVYFTIKDNSTFDLNSTGGFINDPVTFGRFPASNSPDQIEGVLSCIAGAVIKKTSMEDLVTTYGSSYVDGFTPVSDLLDFNATVSPANSTAVFRFNSTSLTGLVSDMTLRKFFSENSSTVDYGDYLANASAEATEGNWWITYRNNTRLSADALLSCGVNYFINFAVKDNGKYDANPAEGNITDPVVLGTADSLSSSSGCMLNPAAGLGLEWILVLLTPLAALIRGSRKSSR